MAAPLTQTQVAELSILDIYGRQNYLGNAFIATTIVPVPDIGIYHPLLLIKNPAGSGKSVFIFRETLASTTNYMFFFFYKNPTVTVLGDVLPANNLRTGSTTASVTQCYEGSTVSSSGTLIGTFATNGATVDLNFIVDPGNSFLVSGYQLGSFTSYVYVTPTWYEI